MEKFKVKSQGRSLKMANKDIKYSEAINELDEILQRIQGEEVDVDDLAKEVKRAVELIKICKGKIEKTEMEVKKVVEGFESTEKEQEET